MGGWEVHCAATFSGLFGVGLGFCSDGDCWRWCLVDGLGLVRASGVGWSSCLRLEVRVDSTLL